MRLTPDVAVVGGGPFFGFGLTPGADAHCYLLDGGNSFALIDCGMGSDASRRQLLANIRANGTDPADVHRLFLTHYHADHSAGSSRYRGELGLSVLASAETSAALERGDHAATGFDAARSLGLYPGDAEFPRCTVDTALADGDEVSVGRLTVRFMATPGHCAGHGAYFVTGGERNYLFSGDALFAGGRLLLQATLDCDLQLSLSSVRAFAAMDFQALLPGHGAVVLTNGHDHALAALATIDSLGIPPNLI